MRVGVCQSDEVFRVYYRIKCAPAVNGVPARGKTSVRRDSVILTFLLPDVPAFEVARIIVCVRLITPCPCKHRFAAA